MLGLIVEFVIYCPMMILVILFKKTKPRHKKSKQMENIVGNSTKKNSTESNIKKVIKFPWFFSIFLFMFSFCLMGFSIIFVLFKGKLTYKNYFHVFCVLFTGY